MEYNTFTLDNGLRVIHLPSDSNVVYCGFQIAAGTRNEKAGEEGLAHFCEHMTFKGTQRRNAMRVLNELERVGGDINAFTNKEDTVFYAAVLREHLPKAVDLLTDIVFHSTYPQHEIDQECEVIVDEPLFTMNVGNGPFSGGGIRQNPDADPQDGIFHAMFVCKPTLIQVIKAIPNLFNGKLTELPFIHAYKGKDIRMETEEHLMFEADGILQNVMGPCEVHCIHHALQFKV